MHIENGTRPKFSTKFCVVFVVFFGVFADLFQSLPATAHSRIKKNSIDFYNLALSYNYQSFCSAPIMQLYTDHLSDFVAHIKIYVSFPPPEFKAPHYPEGISKPWHIPHYCKIWIRTHYFSSEVEPKLCHYLLDKSFSSKSAIRLQGTNVAN